MERLAPIVIDQRSEPLADNITCQLVAPPILVEELTGYGRLPADEDPAGNRIQVVEGEEFRRAG
jgi:hypothetical protein